MRPKQLRCFRITQPELDPSKHLIPQRNARDFPESLSSEDLHQLLDDETTLTAYQRARERNW